MKVRYESVSEFLKRGGKITVVEPKRARGAQKKPTIKVPSRFAGLVK